MRSPLLALALIQATGTFAGTINGLSVLTGPISSSGANYGTPLANNDNAAGISPNGAQLFLSVTGTAPVVFGWNQAASGGVTEYRMELWMTNNSGVALPGTSRWRWQYHHRRSARFRFPQFRFARQRQFRPVDRDATHGRDHQPERIAVVAGPDDDSWVSPGYSRPRLPHFAPGDAAHRHSGTGHLGCMRTRPRAAGPGGPRQAAAHANSRDPLTA